MSDSNHSNSLFPIADQNFFEDCEYLFSLPNYFLRHGISSISKIEGDVHSMKNLEVLANSNFNRKLLSLLLLMIYNFHEDKEKSKSELKSTLKDPKKIDNFVELIKEFPSDRIKDVKNTYIMLNSFSEYRQLKSTEFDLFYRNSQVEGEDRLLSVINFAIEAIDLKNNNTSRMVFTMDSLNLKLFIMGLEKMLEIMSSEGLRLNSKIGSTDQSGEEKQK